MPTPCSADFDPEDVGDTFFQNVGSNMDYYIPEDGNIHTNTVTHQHFMTCTIMLNCIHTTNTNTDVMATEITKIQYNAFTFKCYV
jgi:hypothetical protein